MLTDNRGPTLDFCNVPLADLWGDCGGPGIPGWSAGILGGGRWCGEGAVGFFVETEGDGREGGGEEGVVRQVEFVYGEAGFEGGEGGEHF